MITKNKFILLGATAAMLFASCSNDDQFQNEEAASEVSNLETNNITIFNNGSSIDANYNDFVITPALNNEEEDGDRSARRILHRMNVDATDSNAFPNGDRFVDRFSIAGQFNSRNLATSGRATYSSRFPMARLNIEMRTSALWVSRKGRRGVYAGRITRVNQNSINTSPNSPFQVGRVVVFYFRDTDNPGVGPIIFGLEDSDDEVRERILPGGDLAYGGTMEPFPGGPSLPLRGVLPLDDDSSLNLRRRFNN